jgi:hypothetical protein
MAAFFIHPVRFGQQKAKATVVSQEKAARGMSRGFVRK